MVWYSHLFKNFPQFVVIHTVKGFGIVSKAEVDVFLELYGFFYDTMDVGSFDLCFLINFLGHLFQLYPEYIMRNSWLDEAQTGIKIAGRNINNLRYADDTTLWEKAKKN